MEIVEAENFANSIETSLDRVNSAVFDEENKELLNESEKQRKSEAFKQRWVAAGLALNKDGEVVNSLKELRKKFSSEMVTGAGRGFTIGFGLRASLNAVFFVLRLKRKLDLLNPTLLPKHLAQILTKDVFKLSTFLALYISSFRALNVLFSFLRKTDDQANAALSSFLASISFLIIRPTVGSSRDLSLYLFSRSLAIFTRQLARNKLIPTLSLFPYLMFGVSNIPIMYGFLYLPDILQKSYYKWILLMGAVTDTQLNDSLRAHRDFINNPGFERCAIHDGPCSIYCSTDFFLGIPRAGKIYAPIHLLPLVFRLLRVLYLGKGTDKMPQMVQRTMLSFLGSSIFLTSYQSIVKGVGCYFRNKYKADLDFTGIAAGFLTCLGCIFESRSRVIELMLYCFPRGLEAAYKYLVMYSRLKTSKGVKLLTSIPAHVGDWALFSIGMAILTSGQRQDFKSAYYKALKFLIGK
eukprot:snap_masked-scaffold_2-processed-gene-12.32-mRNA-1 protein AED:1.00 eAED:1.00 QI:0/-1/0/0/-1/1/1/0/464